MPRPDDFWLVREQRRRFLMPALAIAAILLFSSIIGIRLANINRIEGNAIMNFATSGNRGTSQTMPSNPEVQSYQRQQLVLTVNLPPGSEAGEYELEILPSDNGAPLRDVKGRAAVRNGLTMFKAPLDLSTVSPALYRARVRKLAAAGLPDGNWRRLTIQVK